MTNLIDTLAGMVRNDPEKIIPILTSAPELVKQTTSLDNRTLLHLAAGFNKLELLKRLLELGADPNAQDKYGETPIFRSIRFRGDDITEYLISHSSTDVNIQDTLGRTPLHRACVMGTAHSVLQLLEHGADPLQADLNGVTPLQAGMESKYAVNTIGSWESVLEEKMEEARQRKRRRVSPQAGHDGKVMDTLELARAYGTRLPPVYEGASRSPPDAPMIGGLTATTATCNDALDDAWDSLDDSDFLDRETQNIHVSYEFSRSEYADSPNIATSQRPETFTFPRNNLGSPQVEHTHQSESLYKSKDGHLLQCKAHMLIDCWLHDHGITHVIYPSITSQDISGTGTIIPCFYLNMLDVYIAYVGKNLYSDIELSGVTTRYENLILIDDNELNDDLNRTLVTKCTVFGWNQS